MVAYAYRCDRCRTEVCSATPRGLPPRSLSCSRCNSDLFCTRALDIPEGTASRPKADEGGPGRRSAAFHVTPGDGYFDVRGCFIQGFDEAMHVEDGVDASKVKFLGNSFDP